MVTPDINYIIYAPSYNENSGGTIFQHALVNALNARGEKASLWPMAPIYPQSIKNKVKRALRPKPYLTNDQLNTPVATKADLGPNTVVVYPEIVLGNPLGAKHVARWLLYTPGKRHPFKFEKNEMFFRVDEFADLPDLTGGAPDLFLWTVNPAYKNENRPDRKGACFIVRKWGDGPRHPITEGAIQLDGMSHAQINEIFNKCEVFYSYDDATMYSQYAAVAGCLSVVLPSGDDKRDSMLSSHTLGKYGIAYGLEDEKLEHAAATKDKVIGLLIEREREGQRSVDGFLRITQERVFGLQA